MSENLLRLFDSISTEAALEAMVRDQREEDLYVEFKQKADSRNGNLHDDDRKSFSKAVSGFANADGGILVFGVETRKTQDGVDRAATLKPITNHRLFRARLLDSVLNTTQPMVDDIRIEYVDSTENCGYVRCYIPQSIKPPHRAILAGHHYWRRIATGHRRMEHYELEDVFGRRLRPSLRMQLEFRPRNGDDSYAELHFYFLNEGRGLARHVGFTCRPLDVVVAHANGPGLSDMTVRNNGIPTVAYYDPHTVIHANGIYFSVGHVTLLPVQKSVPLPVEVTWYAEDMETRRVNAELIPNQPIQIG